MAWEDLTDQQRERMQLGDYAMAHLHRTESVERWREIGNALNDLQAAAMQAAQTNKPIGKRYNAEYAKLLDHVPHLATRDPRRAQPIPGIDKATKAHAMWLAREWDQIEKWRLTLAINIRMQIVHPTAIRRRWDAAHRIPDDEKERKPSSARLALQDQVKKLTDEMDAMRKLRREGVLPPAKELVQLMRDHHGPAFLRRVSKLCLEAALEEERQYQREQRAQSKRS